MKIVIEKADVKREVFRGSGPGGQNVNKTESCVRLTHIPTGIKAEGRSERSQRQNLQSALLLLLSKLRRYYDDIKREREQGRADEKPSVSFGNQIRSYYLCGQRRVIDHRTGVQSDPGAVLNGKLDPFLRGGSGQGSLPTSE
jgi:peptide chain release factor 2